MADDVLAAEQLGVCPACFAVLPPERCETPWCECGRSSAPNTQQVGAALTQHWLECGNRG